MNWQPGKIEKKEDQRREKERGSSNLGVAGGKRKSKMARDTLGFKGKTGKEAGEGTRRSSTSL